jgi:hypothetical protein
MATAKSDVVVALHSGYYGVGDASILVQEGQVFRANDPIVKKYPTHFGPQVTESERIEQATAAPGEKR